MSGKEMADSINKELAAILEGKLWQVNGDQVIMSENEVIAKYGEDYEYDGIEQMSMGDWIGNAYDTRYIIESNRSYRSCMLMLAGGGPTVWVNTENGMIEYSFGGSNTEYYPLYPGTADEIDEFMSIIYGR